MPSHFQPQTEEKSLREKSTFQIIFTILAVLLMVMPFITTFNEFLTTVIIKIKAYNFIQNVVVPYEAKLIGAVFLPFGFDVAANPKGLVVNNIPVFISWNCIGWQSFILMLITFFTGLQGSYTKSSKFYCVAIGLLGTFLMNIWRISLVVLIAVLFGYLPAVIFHDYFSNILIVIWLFFFWWFSYKYILEDYNIPYLENKKKKKVGWFSYLFAKRK